MDRLIPGYIDLVEQERARLARTYRLDHLPWAPAFAAGAIHLIETRPDAEAWADRLHVDRATIRPQVCSIAAWCGASHRAGEGGGPLIRLLFDLRRPEVHPALRDVFQLHVPWVAHEAKAELHCLWACGIEPPEHLLIDTFITAACLNLGLFHRRQPVADPDEAVARDRKLKAKAARITSLDFHGPVYGPPHDVRLLGNPLFPRVSPNPTLTISMT